MGLRVNHTAGLVCIIVQSTVMFPRFLGGRAGSTVLFIHLQARVNYEVHSTKNGWGS